jgi:hypothetical protein
MLAIIRPDSWDFPLFLHVLGATAVTGATAAAFVTALYSQRWPWLKRLLLRMMLLAVIPAWLLMRLPGQWEDSRSSIGDGEGWLDVGYIVGDAGAVLLLVATILAWIGRRRLERRWPGRAVAVITGAYCVALLVTMFAMTGKPGS